MFVYSGFEAVLIFVIVLCFAIFAGGSYYGKMELKNEAAERGYATYCSHDGSWAWEGECQNE